MHSEVSYVKINLYFASFTDEKVKNMSGSFAAAVKSAFIVAVVFLTGVVAYSFTNVILIMNNKPTLDVMLSQRLSDIALDSGKDFLYKNVLDLCDETEASDDETACQSQIVKNPDATSPHMIDNPDTQYASNGGSVSGFSPADIRSAYKIPDTGSTQTVGFTVAYGYSNLESDLNAYRSYYNLPPCTVANGCLTIVNQNGGTTPIAPSDGSSTDGWASEAALDSQMISAACENCHIVAGFAKTSSVSNQLETMLKVIDKGANYVSLSWGSRTPVQAQQYYDSAYFTNNDVIYFASSGDAGYGVAEYPSSAKRVISVGGTSLHKDSTSERGWTEQAWGGAGSGCDTYSTKSDAQTRINVPCAGKATADLSAVASNSTPVSGYFKGKWYTMAGTSAAAPVVASIYANASVKNGSSLEAMDYIYNNAGYFNDVTSGTNGSCDNILCRAAEGWDGPTGVGTPDASSLFSGLPPKPVKEIENTNDQDGEWKVVGQNLPEGISVNNNAVSGIITTPGNKSFDLITNKADETSDVEFNFVVEIVDENGNVVQTDQYNINAQNLPNGIKLTDNVISGKVGSLGNYNIALTATKRDGSNELAFNWNVNVKGSDSVTPPPTTKDPDDNNPPPPSGTQNPPVPPTSGGTTPPTSGGTSGAPTSPSPKPPAGGSTSGEPAPTSGGTTPPTSGGTSGAPTMPSPKPPAGGSSSSEPAPTSGGTSGVPTSPSPKPPAGGSTSSDPAPTSGGTSGAPTSPSPKPPAGGSTSGEPSPTSGGTTPPTSGGTSGAPTSPSPKPPAGGSTSGEPAPTSGSTPPTSGGTSGAPTSPSPKPPTGGSTSGEPAPTSSPKPPAGGSTSGQPAPTSGGTQPPASSGTNPPEKPKVKRKVDVKLQIALSDLVNGSNVGPNGSKTEQSGTIMDKFAQSKTVTMMDYFQALSQLPAVIGLTPEYTQQRVSMIFYSRFIVGLLGQVH